MNIFKVLRGSIWNMLKIVYFLVCCGCYITTENHQKPRNFTEDHSWGNGQRKEGQSHFIQMLLAGKGQLLTTGKLPEICSFDVTSQTLVKATWPQ